MTDAAHPLEGTVALVTGASSGIGAALVREFARRGADVVAAARREDRLQAVVGDVEGQGRRGLGVVCDVTVDGDLEQVVQQALDRFGRIDWVVANAGFAVGGKVAELELSDYRRQFETNLFGVLRTVRATWPALRESKGVCAIVGSVAGEVTFPGTSAYAMSKAAVHALAEALWCEFEESGVGMTLIVPGYIESEIRSVDAEGVLDPDKQDPVPPRLRMPTGTAARKMVQAMVCRRREYVLTAHGKFAVYLNRHARWLMARLVRRLSGPTKDNRP